jgi:hypothetical protein
MVGIGLFWSFVLVLENVKSLLVVGALWFTMSVQLPFPVIISREGKWFVVVCPLLDIATQGKSEAEVKANLVDLINDYLCDPDSVKLSLEGLK